MARAPKPPRFYFNLRSPYSWFALLELRAHHPELAARLQWRPFWEPDATSARLLGEAGGEFPYTPMSRAKQFYILRDVRRLSAERGLAVTWPVDKDPWWEPAHLAWFVAERHGKGVEWVERVSRARWQEGRDICSPATVRDLAEEIGLDPEEAAGAVTDPEVRAQGVKALQDVQRDGVFGVPYFVNGSEPYWGLDRLADFAASFPQEAAQAPADLPGPTTPAAPAAPAAPARAFEERELALVGGRTTDMSHAGGCG
ncbi:2-hydroxychromene-2-carboxylate isomerase [Streptomyces sp. NPDC091268]|uniref:2-hydroxychromene-2-carboxylate isomerase n=1 Tax=Streptomyces sp. NPDC091268 TaxID=3365979 RepID=UPI0037F2A5E7